MCLIEEEYKQLDILINNAAQTIRKPAGFYKHLIPNEEKVKSELPEGVQQILNKHYESIGELREKSEGLTIQGKPHKHTIGLTKSAHLTQNNYVFDHNFNESEVFPVGKLDADLQQIDLRAENTWNLALGTSTTFRNDGSAIGKFYCSFCIV